MVDREKVIKGLGCLADEDSACHSDCPYFTDRENGGFCFQKMAHDALELLKSLEAARPTTSVLPGTTYQRLMAIKEELEAKNHTLTSEVRELRRLNESLSNLCQNLLKRLAAYET